MIVWAFLKNGVIFWTTRFNLHAASFPPTSHATDSFPRDSADLGLEASLLSAQQAFYSFAVVAFEVVVVEGSSGSSEDRLDWDSRPFAVVDVQQRRLPFVVVVERRQPFVVVVAVDDGT